MKKAPPKGFKIDDEMSKELLKPIYSMEVPGGTFYITNIDDWSGFAVSHKKEDQRLE